MIKWTQTDDGYGQVHRTTLRRGYKHEKDFTAASVYVAKPDYRWYVDHEGVCVGRGSAASLEAAKGVALYIAEYHLKHPEG